LKWRSHFFIGDGKGKPTGILNATGGASDGVTTATANITFDSDGPFLFPESALPQKGGVVTE